MSFNVLFDFNPVFEKIFIKRISNFLIENDNIKPDITIEIEILFDRLPGDSPIPSGKLENGIYSFNRYDMTGIYNIERKHLNLKIFNNHFSFDTALRVIFSFLLIRKKGCLMHSSSIIYNGTGILFIGVSGAGKTTIAHLNKDNCILSDEISSISYKENSYFIHGNTFFSDNDELGPNRESRLDQIFVLNKADHNAIGPIQKNQSFSHIIRNIMCFVKDRSFADLIMENTLDLINNVKIHNLYFLPDIDVYDVIKEHLKNIS